IAPSGATRRGSCPASGRRWAARPRKPASDARGPTFDLCSCQFSGFDVTGIYSHMRVLLFVWSRCVTARKGVAHGLRGFFASTRCWTAVDVISAVTEGGVKAAFPAGPSQRIEISLEDKYSLEQGQAVVTGTQALVLLMMMQRRRDQRAGLRTAGLCTGYRGSPLSTLDQEFQRAHGFLTPLDIRYQGGVNEALAATVA